jgi:outer membrane beta-barrel protein
METGIRVFLLGRLLKCTAILAAGLALQGCGLFGGAKEPPPLGAETEAQQGPDASEQPVINPEVQRREVKVPTIGSQDFEVTLAVGILSIEDFGAGTSLGARIAYHITEDFYLELNGGVSKGGTTSYERLAGGPQLLTDDDRKYTYGALNVGWDALPGEVFIGKNLAYNSAFYLTAGLGGTNFAGDTRFTLNAGFGYRVLFTRTFAAHFDVRDYMFDIDLLGQKKVANNLEGSLGLSVFF